MRPESRIESAISFGVFWRSAPSTSAIIRSRKVEPGAAVIFTLTQSESTVVPPVTAERSPPDSRMTGADSPVIADSLIEAMPSMTSPSDGMRSPASTSTTSPILRSSAFTDWYWRVFGSTSRFAIVSERMRRKVSACALPRPSATASAKLAKRTVNQSQAAIWPVKKATSLPVTRSRTKRMVTTSDTTSVTKITGLRASLRGSSLRTASPAARPMMAPSKRLSACILVDMVVSVRGSSAPR